jgi:hypothetical protein
MELVFIWLGLAVVTGLAATGRGRSFWGWLLIGILTGIFGLVAVLVMKPVTALPAPSTERSGSSRSADLRPATYSPPAAPASLRVIGDGAFSFDIVGEASYQDSLEHFAGGKKERSANLAVQASVEPDDLNPHDPNAIKVMCRGVTVGYLSRQDAIAWRSAMTEQEGKVQKVSVRAVIVGGWRDDISEGDYGMRLDMVKPFRFRRE